MSVKNLSEQISKGACIALLSSGRPYMFLCLAYILLFVPTHPRYPSSAKALAECTRIPGGSKLFLDKLYHNT